MFVIFMMYVFADVVGIITERKLEQQLGQMHGQLKQAEGENDELEQQNKILRTTLDSVGVKIEDNFAVWQDCFSNTWNQDLQTGEWSVVGCDPLMWNQKNGDYIATAN
jgi:hypothetical protein